MTQNMTHNKKDGPFKPSSLTEKAGFELVLEMYLFRIVALFRGHSTHLFLQINPSILHGL